MQETKLRQINNSRESIVYFFGIVLLAAVLRVLPHPPNIIPITALSLFSGAMIKRKFAFIIPLFAMILSDIFLGFHSTIPYVYGSFVLITLIGEFLGNKKTFIRLCSMSLMSSMLFFVITNFGVWATSGMYVRDANGLLNAYVLGLPFFKNSLFGDLFYTLSFFYGYQLYLLFSKKLAFRFKK